MTHTHTIAKNKRARHEYDIEETIEAGIILYGSEVKSLRWGHGNIQESYASESNGKLIIFNMNILAYSQTRDNHEPKRPRELLVKKRERKKLFEAIKRQGMTLVPLEIYFNTDGKIKVELGLAKGRKKQDKRQAIKQKDWQKQQQRIIKNKNR